MRKKLPSEGAVFLVPLRGGGYGTGVLARVTGEGHCFGYFFGPPVQSREEVDCDALNPGRAILVGKFGDLEFRRGNWEVIGEIRGWEELRWKMLPLARVDESGDRAWLSLYDDNFNCVSEKQISVKEATNYPYDRMMGAGAVEIRLTKLLRESLNNPIHRRDQRHR